MGSVVQGEGTGNTVIEFGAQLSMPSQAQAPSAYAMAHWTLSSYGTANWASPSTWSLQASAQIRNYGTFTVSGTEGAAVLASDGSASLQNFEAGNVIFIAKTTRFQALGQNGGIWNHGTMTAKSTNSA